MPEEYESTVAIAARINEVSEIVAALARLDNDLRQTAAQNLGKVGHDQYIGLTAQAALLATLQQTLGPRVQMLQKAHAEAQDRDVEASGRVTRMSRKPRPVAPEDRQDDGEEG